VGNRVDLAAPYIGLSCYPIYTITVKFILPTEFIAVLAGSAFMGGDGGILGGTRGDDSDRARRDNYHNEHHHRSNDPPAEESTS